MRIDKENRELMQAFELIAHTNSSFFLTGRAGTGKTTFLREVQETVKDKQFITLAPTGVAAILAGGETIHSFFGLPMGVCAPDTYGAMNEARIMTLLHTDAIIIDEVSMVRCDMVDAIDRTMRKVLRSTQPFGGKQVIFVGDLFQLPPVVTRKEERMMLNALYNTNEFFFYKAEVVKRMRLAKIEFQKVYRQDDKQYLNILESVRLNKLTPEELMHLNSRVCRPAKEDGIVITLASSNDTANEVNQQRLDEIDAKEYIYEGHVEGRFEEKRFPVEKTLRLKVGAQVMFTRNDPARRWANGTLGKVAKLTDSEIQVTTEQGNTYPVTCCSWDSPKFEYDPETKKLKKEVVGTFTQYPLKLAWAITIHKSQGMTFEKMQLNLERGLFMSGQLYVALSRVRSLAGLFLSRPVALQYANTSREVLTFANGYNDERVISSEIETGQAVYAAQQRYDYDETARLYLNFVQKKVADGDIKEALQQAKRFLDSVICDEHLFGKMAEVPSELTQSKHWTHLFLAALLGLYHSDSEQALACIDEVLKQHQCTEALFLKVRCLMKLERYNDADEVAALLWNMFDMATTDAKVLYMISTLNEQHLGTHGLKMMQQLIAARPKYDKALLALRGMMKQKGLFLIKPNNEPRELVDAFNSEATDEDFAKLLSATRQKAPKAVEYLLRLIKRQEMQT